MRLTGTLRLARTLAPPNRAFTTWGFPVAGNPFAYGLPARARELYLVRMKSVSDSPQPGRRRSWRRKLLYISGTLLVLLVVAYFVVTSSAFFKGVILPRAGKAIGGEVTVADASLSPFSQVIL